MDVEVAVRTADGTRWGLTMPPGGTVLELKEQIAAELQVPVDFQILVDASGATLENPDDLIRMQSSEELTLVISLKEICTTLGKGCRTPIEKALKTMMSSLSSIR